MQNSDSKSPAWADINRNRDITYFGATNFRNREQVFGIKRRDRRQHMYIIGKTGTGKTALLNNLAIQDIAHGDGLCVVDPHGEFVEGLLSHIPPSRYKDVVYVNPADEEYHVGFNVLELPDPKYKHLVASGLMGIFTKIWANVWSSRMEYILNNTILALLETPGTTLLGIPRMLVDKNYRQRIIANVKDPVVKAFWVQEYEEWRDQFRNEAISPIQNKVGQFLSTSIVRNIVGQKKSTINIFDIMNERKILLLNVSKGRVGEDISALLGAMFITKIQLMAMERVRIPEQERNDFYLYVDEFQNFATDSFADILSEARKYRLDLVLAHQYIGQLVTEVSTRVRDAVFGNVGTMLTFRVGAEDAEFLEKELSPEFMSTDIVQLPNYRIYTKLMIDGETSRPFSANTLPPIEEPLSHDIKARELIIAESRKRYCRPRADVEREVNEWSGLDIAGGGTGGDVRGRTSDFSRSTQSKAGGTRQGGDRSFGGNSGRDDARTSSTPRAVKIDKSIPALAALGIEFTTDEKVATRKPPISSTNSARVKPSLKARPYPQKGFSLKSIKDSSEEKTALRDALSKLTGANDNPAV
ncbi:MAG: hypothetical protein COV07_02020 [Candidatus Vogelbacteria bacterium CG10_big_fil_rev_8_21_14_0_10_45_14]|uniref:Type IV secretion system coupling protein TraD DNA-binding domain-containing protein n=1 Tax=Candidatus Vogelbacteria bacterium CG10_big_fil_rev_8_21_14_0_10_45_14 TaxID=1975042 RepID=A0A2H0RJY6_9BACT|nr:MAG: hypothetical protein COV07_02020 [Candidatus Vogelbacteria bacterium CG10_big_fil_rev_8_21_14_0_10_45_14]